MDELSIIASPEHTAGVAIVKPFGRQLVVWSDRLEALETEIRKRMEALDIPASTRASVMRYAVETLAEALDEKNTKLLKAFEKNLAHYTQFYLEHTHKGMKGYPVAGLTTAHFHITDDLYTQTEQIGAYLDGLQIHDTLIQVLFRGALKAKSGYNRTLIIHFAIQRLADEIKGRR